MTDKNEKTKLMAQTVPIVATMLMLLAPLANAQSDPAAADEDQPNTQQPPGEFRPSAYDDVEEPMPTEATELFDNSGVLTPRNTLIVEPSLQFSHSSANRVAIEAFTILPAIAVGLIDVREVRRNTLIGAATFRYGLTNRLELEARLPYVIREDEVRQRQLLEASSSDVIIDSDGNGIGDIEAAIHYQFNQPTSGGAYFIGNLRVKSRTGTDVFEVDREIVRQDDLVVGERLTEQPTGSGFWAIEPSLTWVLPSDPAVFFGNFSYTWNLERDVNDDVGTVDPGDFVGFDFGMGFGVNSRTSFSLGYSHTIVFETEQEFVDEASEFDSIHIATLLIGFGHQFSRDSSVNLSLGIGITEDSPDLQLTVRSPITLF